MDVSSTRPATPSAASVIINVSKAFNFAGIVVLGLLTVITVLDVLGRALLNTPVTGSTELTEYMMVCIGFLGLAWCAAEGRHVNVTLLTEHLSPRVQIVLQSIMQLITLIVLALITWRGILESLVIQQSGRESVMLHVPVYPFYWVMSISYIVFCLMVAVLLIQSVAKAAKR